MMPAQRGFTLIELLVVLVVLGLIAGIGVANLGGSNLQRELINEANRLHAVMRMASEEAVVANEEIGVYLDEDGYGFVTYDEQEASWTESQVTFMRAHTFPEWMRLDYQRVGKKREIPTRQDDDARDVNLAEQQAARTPDLMLLSSGETSEFIIGLEIQQQPDSRIEIKTNEKGVIVFGDEDARDG